MYGAHGGETPGRRGARPCSPLTAYAESKVRAEAGARAPRRRRLLARLHAQRHRVRRLTAPAPRHRAQQPRRLGRHDRPDQDHERRHAVAAARPRSTTSPERRVALLEAPRDVVHAEAFNIGGGQENYQVRELAEIVGETVPGCTVEYAGSGDPDPRSYRVDFGKFARAFPDFRVLWNARRGAEELSTPTARRTSRPDDFEGEQVRHGCGGCGALLEGGRLDEALRWLVARRAGATMIFTATELPGAYVIDLERREDERGFFARTFCRGGVRGARPAARSSSQCNLSFNRSARDASRDALSGEPRTRRPSSSAARAARSRTSIVDMRPESPTYRSRHRRRADAPRTAGPLRAGGCRARLPDPRRRHRGAATRSATFYTPRRTSGACATTTRRSRSSGRVAVER